MGCPGKAETSQYKEELLIQGRSDNMRGCLRVVVSPRAEEVIQGLKNSS